MNSHPKVLQTVADALGQAGIGGDGRFGGGLHLGALDQPAQPGALALEGAIRKSTAMAALVARDSSQSITNATQSWLSFSAAASDPFGMWSAAVPERLTAYTGGLYLLWCMLGWEANASGQRYLDFRLNGGAGWVGTTVINGGAYTQYMSTCALCCLNEGDYAEVQVYQNSGGALNVVVGNGILFGMARMV